ncbi:amidohydrolase [Oceanisphaera arctica]|uniref:N-acyl-L-amino acid amidohydrolase n=1 Tax=Oceanisphaera arctica TaxID=641510 RepID=A0A2P5TN97_9GAMM|nr:amidohydrolase [Oceanisphaera arctica]PPL17003.1 N-acyl-L-amino acid amidohydrolase [Oceanisphaera arctica]GHA07489.1 N-acyl-L-amino acid amidohydrolase [Oceanisphaera arctica]
MKGIQHAKRTRLAVTMAALLAMPMLTLAETPDGLSTEVRSLVEKVTPDVVSWRRDIHQHPELGNRETRTAALVAKHLKSLGMEVKTGIAHTGVVGILKGARPGPVVALRADMDALPVTEATGLSFASRIRTQYNDEEVGVAHACGHDMHVAILMGTAQVLAETKEELAGTVMFVFQPAEEGPPAGEEGGAELMLKEGVFDDLKPDAMFSLHVMPAPLGQVAVRTKGQLASADTLRIEITGKQTHGGSPWSGIDPIVTASQVVMGLQTIPSRQLDVTRTPSVISIGSIKGGVRSNIIPDNVVMEGTIRTFDNDTRAEIHQRIEQTAVNIAESAGASAKVSFAGGIPATINDPDLTKTMIPTLQRIAGDKFVEADRSMAAEDFAFFAEEVPSMYVFLGINPEDPAKVHFNHSPEFNPDERALPIGVSTMTALVLDYGKQHQAISSK